MLKNYLTVALRNLWKNKFYSLINILGLAIGLACFLFILLYVRDELSYDRYHKKADRIYRINFDAFAFGQEMHLATSSPRLGPGILEEYPEIEQQCRLRDNGSASVRYENQSYREEQWIFADSTLFEVFDFQMLKGDPRKALAEPYTVVITDEIARKYFGDEDPIGKSLTVDNDELYRVTGVMKSMPKNSHMNFNLIASMESLEESRSPSWLTYINFPTYVVLKEGIGPEVVNAKFPSLIETRLGPELEQFVGKTYEDLQAEGSYITFTLFPLTKIHLYSGKQAELGANSDIKYVYIFTFIGIFILLLACINFMNLSTARASTRSKEVGMRKVAGAGRPQLIVQFLSESVVITFLGLVIAVSVLVLLLPYFNELAVKSFTLEEINDPLLWGLMLGLVLIVGIIAGSYPAFFLSAFSPVATLKAKVKKGGGKSTLRSALVIFQFAITVGLIVGTIVISNQLQYIQNKKLGFEKEQVIILNDYYMLENNCKPFKEEIKKHPQVINATMSGYLPTPSNRNTSTLYKGRNIDGDQTHLVQMFEVDHDYFSTLGMEIVEGRAFSRDFPSDSSAVILNEAAVEMFSLEDPLGQEVSSFVGGTPDDPDIRICRVVGVVKNFHFDSLRDKIGPLALFLSESRSRLSIKVKTENLPQFISELNALWNQMGPGLPFDYTFLDDQFAAVYESETRIGRIFSIFTFMAIFIACLGLFGLATFTAEQRTKEVGIRKVLGASIPGIFFMLTAEVMKWVLIANLIALPPAYLFMKKWLQGFAYPVNISWTIFLTALFIGLAVALITVSYQALRAAVRNPVKALRYE